MRVKFAIAIFVLLLMLGNAFSAQADTLKLLQPNGGDVWYKGTLQTIAWQGGDAGQIEIDLYRGQSLQKKLGSVDSSAGLFIWRVASDLPTAEDYRVKIHLGSASDFSDAYFTIKNSNSRPQGRPDGNKPPDDPDGNNSGSSESITSLKGGWIGGGAGEEVRFRNRNLTLTVKHASKFFLYIDDKDEITGEGTIEYDLDQNTEGLDELVAEIRGMISAFVPSIPSLGVSKGPVRDFAKDRISRGLQYEAPHLKYGPEIRHINIKGWVEKVKLNDYDGARVYLQVQGDYTLPDDTADNELIASWEVNKVKEESKFPCWSPFLEQPGIVRKGPGGYWVIEFQQKGEHRNRVNAWQEYGYYWTARQITKEEIESGK
jgi:hypothetical protein